MFSQRFLLFIYLKVPINPPPIKREKKNKNGTWCSCWKSFTVTYCYHGSKNEMNISNVRTSNVLIISEGFLSKGFLRICWGMHQQFGFTPIAAIAIYMFYLLFISFIFNFFYCIILLKKKRILLFLRAEWKWHLKKKKKKNMAEECRRESGSPSCSIVFVSLCFVTKMWQREADRTLSIQMMSYKMYTILFLLNICQDCVGLDYTGARGCREEGRCFAVSKPQRDECKDLQVLLFSVR